MHYRTVITALALVMTTAAQNVSAQAWKEIEAYFDTDIVSHYLWRGQDISGPAVQPEAYVSYKGLTLKMEGSAALRRDEISEIDLLLGYEYEGFNIGVTDYWTTGIDEYDRYFHYNSHGPHQLEANIGYSWKYGSLQAYTIFAGNDYKVSGSRAFSTFIEYSVPFTLADVDWTASVGITPFESSGMAVPETNSLTGDTQVKGVYFYAESFACNMVALRATKTLQFGSFHLPLYAEFHANPYLSTAHFLFGLTITPF